MKKKYFSPEIEISKFLFEQTLLQDSNEGNVGEGGGDFDGNDSGEEVIV